MLGRGGYPALLRQAFTSIRARGPISSTVVRSLSALRPSVRMLATKVKGIEQAFQRSDNEAAQQVKSLGKRTTGEWMSQFRDELVVVLLAALFLLSSLRLLRYKGEALAVQQEHQADIAKLEEDIEKLKQEILASMATGAPAVASEYGIWTKKHGDFRKSLEGLVKKGIAEANKPPPPPQETVEEEFELAIEREKSESGIGQADRPKPKMI